MTISLFTKKLLSLSLTATAAGVGVISSVVPAQAYLIYFGEDINGDPNVPLASFPNASDAEADFLSNLQGVGTEDFEGFSAGTGTPLNLTFPGSTGNITATLSGGGGTIDSVPVGQTNGAGRYATSGTNFFEVDAGSSNNFEVTFDSPVAAFGFYGVDIGDFGGQLQLELTNGTTQTVTVPNTGGSNGSTDGSVLFYGIVAENSSQTFTSVSFLTTTGQGDIFAFDDFTVGDLDQVVPPPPGTPEPASMLGLLAVGALGAGSALKRKRN
ncbi:PEP-CTERM sorting domain-containing protein [Chroococcus sp. FPU101]|uniref:PEP-CTERM sorting domain-containing protein n=1 Tax=Chroococcus sp. FPU101 TaxID=1974212 RepID=UPI001AA55A1B|nr:PEP-CTERM sorting domain-containing protein [Chroococcus sp. FPU101]GFE71206.1 hypothetical protein CFPU101_38160 [Chroococcus sp. FPU101]